MNKIALLLFLITSPLVAMANNTKEYLSISDVPESAWNTLAGKRIFFGHQSVGRNIIQGIEKLQQENSGIKFDIKYIEDLNNPSGGFFAHENIGENRLPLSKLQEFTQLIQDRELGELDVAALKFCYVDFEKEANVQEVFNEYTKAINKMQEEQPNTQIIHLTVPLRTVQSGVKAWVKQVLGKPLYGAEANIFRNNYNKLLMEEYGSSGLVFDIAELESTLPDGSRREFKDKDQTYYSLAEVYTNDGGHLNELGQSYIAEEFLLFLLQHTN